MSLVTQITDLNGNRLRVGDEGEISVIPHTHPPLNEKILSLPYRQYFSDDGLVDGSNDMRVDGSSTNIDFYISALQREDVYVKTINVKLADSAAKFNKFGNLTALANGVSFRWESQVEGELIIHDGIKDTLEWFRMSDQVPTIIDLSGGGADAAIITIDLTKLFGSPWGVKLSAGTNDKIAFSVRDKIDVGLDEFTIIGYGVKIQVD